MKGIRPVQLVLVSVGVLAGVIVAGGHGANGVDDPYAPLRLYDGKWGVASSDGEKEIKRIENHCVKTGLFFVCEQMVADKTSGLLVVLPVAKLANGGEEYRTQGLTPDASPPGDWGKLTIDGERWAYSWDDTVDGKKVYGRNINTFHGPDRIHFEILSSEDGSTWTSKKSGDEQRVK